MNPIAANPEINPTTAAGIIAIACVASCVCTSKYTVDASSSNSPNFPSFSAEIPECNVSAVNTDTIQAKKTCHPRLCCQKLASSSNMNSSPPTGALNAVATPTAAPAVTKLRLSVGF